MRFSIATVSLGGALRAKLAAIAEAGFEGVEIFETDILAHDGPPAEVGRMARDLGLEIVALQPFRDFEGMPDERRDRTFARARRKFDLMVELGAPTLLVCSNISPQAQGGVDRAAADLRALGDLAAEAGVSIGFEALAWGRFIRDWRDAWEAVRRADHPAVRLVLDSFHTLAPGYPVAPIATIPADRIAFVQLADAPAIEMDALQLSRHLRLFPGQGDLDIAGFMDAVRATGFDGWISHEIFNDRFRMASTRRIAADGERSLIAMTGRARGGRPLPPRPAIRGAAFLEFAVDEATGADLARLFRAMGFRRAGQHRTKDVTRHAQGGINLLINTETEGFAHSHFITHGPSVAAICLSVADAGAQMNRAEALLAQGFRAAVGPGELDIPAIRGVGGSLLHFIDEAGDLARLWEIDFAPVEDLNPPAGLTAVDHIAQSIPYEELPSWRLFYQSILDVEKAPVVDVIDPGGLVESQVLQSPDRSIRLTLNASQSRRTLSGRFMEELFGAGVQHVAFATADIFATVERLRAAGVALLPIPDNYYDDLEARFDLEPDLAARLRALDILYDEDERGAYFQVYTAVFAERFFFEIVERRDGYDGFGAPNAPIRLAAQTRLARDAAMPRR
ncbi:MAG: bifunctional sugar phosphate isomerase/epimerase/4-hydroxyphenylpyruvate dioxygenase family protein [Rubrimonas sp.]